MIEDWIVTHERLGTVEVRSPDRVGAIMAAAMVWRVDWFNLGLTCKTEKKPKKQPESWRKEKSL